MLKGARKKCYKDFADYMSFLLSLDSFLPSNCIPSGPQAPLVPLLHPHLVAMMMIIPGSLNAVYK